jgi:hypothetical protein
MEKEIARTEMTGVYSDGHEIDIIAKVGKPTQVNDQDWACSIELEPLHSNLNNIHGVDSMQALNLASGLLYNLLSGFLEKGGKLLNKKEKTEIDLEAIFHRPKKA